MFGGLNLPKIALHFQNLRCALAITKQQIQPIITTSHRKNPHSPMRLPQPMTHITIA